MEIIVIAVIILVIVGWLVYEIIMAPLMPDDYGLRDEEIKEVEDIHRIMIENDILLIYKGDFSQESISPISPILLLLTKMSACLPFVNNSLF